MKQENSKTLIFTFEELTALFVNNNLIEKDEIIKFVSSEFDFKNNRVYFSIGKKPWYK